MIASLIVAGLLGIQGGVGTNLYPPPAHYQALRAVQTEFEARANASYFSDATADLLSKINYPLDIQLHTCEQNFSRYLPTASGQRISRSGFDCVMDVFPAGEPNYRIYGFFYHSGFEWVYYGALNEGLIIEIDRFGDDLIVSHQNPIAGGIIYSGQPHGTSNLKNPYRDILESYGWDRE